MWGGHSHVPHFVRNPEIGCLMWYWLLSGLGERYMESGHTGRPSFLRLLRERRPIPDGFLQENRRLLVSRTRIGIVLGVSILLAFVPVDALRVPANRFVEAAAIRLLGCALLIPLFLVLSRSSAEEYAEWIAAIVVVVLSAVTIAMVPLFAGGVGDMNYVIQVMGIVFVVMGAGLLLPLDGATMALLGFVSLLLHVVFTMHFPIERNFPALFATLTAVVIATVGARQLFQGRIAEYEGRLAKDALIEAKEALLRAQASLIKGRADFVAMLTHDIKNPLGVIMGLTEILRDEPRDLSARSQVVDGIDSAAHAAMSLALNFLQADQIESGSLKICRAPASLNEIVDHAVRHQAARARLNDVGVRMDLDPSLPPLDLDKPLIDRVVANLLSNAIKFSPRGGLVRVVTSFRDRTANLAIHDQGPGIATEDRAGLFQRYYRGSESRADSTGLGLWIVKSITEAHGGAVSTDCSADGGSVFRVSIPCDKI